MVILNPDAAKRIMEDISSQAVVFLFEIFHDMYVSIV